MIKVIGLNTKVLKKEPFSGSHHGMRFFMRAENDILHVWVYRGKVTEISAELTER